MGEEGQGLKKQEPGRLRERGCWRPLSLGERLGLSLFAGFAFERELGEVTVENRVIKESRQGFKDARGL